MTVAGWIFCKNDNGSPHLPLGVGGSFVNPLEIHTITGGPSGFEHTHLLIGGAALPSLDRVGQPDEHHRHMVAWYGNQYHQLTIGATNHQHDINPPVETEPGVFVPGDTEMMHADWFLIWWKGSDADGALIVADPECVIAVQAVGEQVEVEPGEFEEQFNELDDTLWTPAERTLWENRMGSVLAITLPPEVNAGDKLVAYFCGALVGRPNQRERWLRGN